MIRNSVNLPAAKLPRRRLGRLALGSAIFLVSLGFFGCSPSQVEVAPKDFLQDGSIALAGPIPEVQPLSSLASSASVLGFAPSSAAHEGAWLSIDSKSAVVHLMRGTEELRSGVAEGVGSLKAGTFALKHKQRGALWYAPDSYFSARGLNIPAQGQRERLLRGALGEFSLFLDKNTPIHSGPVWSKEIGGIRLDENLLSQLYYSLEVGAPIEVR